VVLKIPSTDLRDDAAALDRFVLEEWVARRIDSAHVLKATPPIAARSTCTWRWSTWTGRRWRNGW
jgi:hypothetical protein